MARAYPAIWVLVLAACSTPTSAPSEDWTAPAWFAQQAREIEESTAAQQSCMDARGWQVTINEGGGSSQGFTDQDELARFAADGVACRTELGLPTYTQPPTAAQVRQTYPFMLDTWRCLRHDGYDLADPPSEDSWVESVVGSFAQSNSTFWVPYEDPVMAELPGAEREAAEVTCPQYRAPW